MAVGAVTTLGRVFFRNMNFSCFWEAQPYGDGETQKLNGSEVKILPVSINYLNGIPQDLAQTQAETSHC